MEDINEFPFGSQNSTTSSIEDFTLRLEEENLLSELSDHELNDIMEEIGPVKLEHKKVVKKEKYNQSKRKVFKKKTKKAHSQSAKIAELKKTIEEYSALEGEQVVVLIANSSNKIYNIFGSEKLKNVVKQSLFNQFEYNSENMSVSSSEVKYDLNSSQVSSIASEDFKLIDLPLISVDGKPTSLNQMSIKNLQKFIQILLKCTTGREKPEWKNKYCQPEWWPVDIPWLSIRRDNRPSSEKEKETFSDALRRIIINCYKFYNREDILNDSNIQTKNSDLNNNANKIDIKYNFINGNKDDDFKKVDMDLSIENQTFFDNDGQLILKFNNAYFDTKNGVINVPVPLSVYKSITECSQNNPNRCITVTFNEKEK